MKIAVSLALTLVGCGVSQDVSEQVTTPQQPDVTPSLPHRTYSIVPIPAIRESEAARAICGTPDVVGTTSADENHRHAVVFDGVANTDLGTLGGNFSVGLDGNTKGIIVGVSTIAPPGSPTGGFEHAFRYANGSMTDLGGIGGDFNRAFAINNHGEIVGGAATPGNDRMNRAVLWKNCTVTELGQFEGGDASLAFDLNDRGDIVGEATLPDHRTHAALWRNGQIIDLGTGGALDSHAQAINAEGTIAGFTAAPTRAVIWSGGAMTSLGTLGGDQSFAYGVDDRGDVVGKSTITGNEGIFKAFLYADGTMLDLEQFVDTSHWNLFVATDVCNDGRIVGSGVLDGETRGFVMTPCP